MKHLVSRLNVHQLDLIVDLLRARNRIGKEELSPTALDETIQKIEHSLKHQRDAVYFFGAFKPTGPRGAVSVMCQQFSSEFPSDWLMSLLLTRPGMGFAKFDENGHNSLWTAAVNTARSSGRTIARWSMPAKWARSESRTKLRSEAIMNLHIEPYLLVPAGKYPESRLDAWVYGDRVKPYDVLLKRAHDLRDQVTFDDPVDRKAAAV